MRRPGPQVSIVFATHNRRGVALRTVEKIRGCGLGRRDYELIVVDNASTDGAADALEEHVDQLIRLHGNRGSTAKAYGVDRARGEHLVFLDDDSYPRAGSLERMLEHFEADAALGAAGFRVHLPDGREEGAALPGVFVGCGVGFRTSAYRAVGGLDRTFFMQAEEYDLSFRMASHRFGLEIFDDLHVMHEKTPHARRSERTTYFDIRNNLRVIARYVPTESAGILTEDCLQRYEWLAERCGHLRAFEKGKARGAGRAGDQRARFAKHRLDAANFERFFGFGEISRQMDELRSAGVDRVLLAGFGKNIYPFVAAARDCGVEIAGILDDVFAAPNRAYRGVPIMPLESAPALDCDAIVVSNTAPVHAAFIRDRLAERTAKPIHAWFGQPSASAPSRGTTSHRLAPMRPMKRGSSHPETIASDP